MHPLAHDNFSISNPARNSLGHSVLGCLPLTATDAPSAAYYIGYKMAIVGKKLDCSQDDPQWEYYKMGYEGCIRGH